MERPWKGPRSAGGRHTFVRVSDTGLVRNTDVVSDLAVVDVVPSEAEAELLCSVLQEAGIPAMQRLTSMGAGAADGMPSGGPREILVRPEQLARAREVLERDER